MSRSQSEACKVICEISLNAILKSRCVDISESGTPGKYRLISCVDLIEAETLTILEYSEFPEVSFAALSYVWRGNKPDADFDGRTFNAPVLQKMALNLVMTSVFKSCMILV
ncbi:hypothetical protein GGI43DRAFT_100115 [Trichoderma evansii]